MRRWAPVAVVLVVAAAVVLAVVLSGEDGENGASPDGAQGSPDSNAAGLPEGVLPFSVASERGEDVAWPDTCDTERGAIAIPLFYAAECFAPFSGSNGGSTAPGVTDTSIKIVVFQTPDDDPILSAIASLVSDDTNEQARETLQAMIPFFQTYYETYGREVELVFYEGTGRSDDEVAARADAETIAEEHQPFMVWGSPTLAGEPFAEELAARGISAITLGAVGTSEFYSEHDPALFSVGISAEQARAHLAEYMGKRLDGEPAAFAGDPDLQQTERVFGTVYLETGPESVRTLEAFEDLLAEHGITLAARLPYTDPTALGAEAPGIIARLKEAGVTSVVLTTDPLAPRSLTSEATAQEYFPEWILTGTALVDTTAFGRIYDQEQWAHAFGPSNLSARTAPQVAGFWRLYEWWNCVPPPADDTITLVLATPSLFYSVLQRVGPDLTPTSFRDAAFSLEPTPSAITNPSLSFGDHRRWPHTDYFGIDDATEVWWDPSASGPDETGAEGDGMYRYVDGGRRYLPGEWPSTPPQVFEPDGAVDLYEEPPEGERPPDYASPCE